MCFCITFFPARESQRLEGDLSEIPELLTLNQNVCSVVSPPLKEKLPLSQQFQHVSQERAWAGRAQVIAPPWSQAIWSTRAKNEGGVRLHSYGSTVVTG